MRVLVVVSALVAASSGCGGNCRTIDHRALALQCERNSSFRGEIHLDSEAVYDSFLRDQCIPEAGDTDIADAVKKVDFDVDAVFVAGDTRQQQERCIEEREVETAEVCDDGLRVTFRDRVTDKTPCPDVWTIAFKLSRADLRAAIE
jgi:hypothetical protein